MKRDLSRITFLFLTFIASFSASTLVGAIDVQSAAGTWNNAASDSGPLTNFSGGGTNEIHWGVPVSGINNSGYNFTSLAPISNLAIDTPFALGTFTHYNFPITGNFLSSVDLIVSAVLNINGTLQPFSGTYHFLHDETPNITTQQNPNCCNDFVTFQNNIPQSGIFNINGIDYTIGLLGFKSTINGPLVSQFSTIEGQTNTATLFATISQPQVLAPEPSTYLILGSLLMASMWMYRKRNRGSIS